jgi:asparagine synthase (glutamine-hydrolysing)
VVGSLDDRVELAAELALPPTAPAHAVVAAGYRRWGTGVLPRLRGAYALLLWNVKEHSGLLATDRLGTRTVVWSEDAGRIAFATDVRDLLDLLPATPAPSDGAVVSWLVDGGLPRSETLYERVARGQYLALGRAPSRPLTYWTPRRQPQTTTRTDAIDAVAVALDAAAARAASRADRIGVLLSGGLDSTAVAAAAASARRGVVAYSAVFPNHPSTDESVHIDARVRALGLASRRVAIHRSGCLAATLRHLHRWRTPSGTPNLFFHEPLLRTASDDGTELLLDGQGGDELFGAAAFLVADLVGRGHVRASRRLASLLAGPGGTGAAWRRYGLLGAVPARAHFAPLRVASGPPEWLTTLGSTLYRAPALQWSWKSTSGPRWWAHQSDRLTFGRERAGVHETLRQMFASAGLAGAHPLLADADLVETVLSLPPELSFDATYDRPLLRDALRGRVPDEVRLRPDKSYFNDVLAAAVHDADAAPIARLLGDEARVARYVQPDVLTRLQGAPARHRGGRPTWLLWRLASIECWLRQQEDPAFAEDALGTWGLVETSFDVL